MVKHKIVSKAEGRIVDLATIKPSPHSATWANKYKLDARVIELALRESRAVIRRKNGVLITETRHGFICANSGVDVSNVDGRPPRPSSASRSRPLRPQTSRRTQEAHWPRRSGSDHRHIRPPWREGLVDFCIGIAGMKALRDDRGRRDSHGYLLQASLEALADELACRPSVCGRTAPPRACIIPKFSYEPTTGRITGLLRPAANDLFR